MSEYKSDMSLGEVGKLWVTYIGNTMSVRILSYFLKHVEDEDIKGCLEFALDLSNSIITSIESIFIQENFPVPIGLTAEDVNLAAPRLFADEYYLYYLKYVGKAGMSIYSNAIPLLTRKDIASYYVKLLESTTELMIKVNTTMYKKGLLMNPPKFPYPDQVEIVEHKHYLSGYFGNVRPLHSLEVTHLYDCIQNDCSSKALIIGFSQIVPNQEMKKYFMKGVTLNQKHINICSAKLSKGNLPSPSLLDHFVSTSTVSPFSEKLMLMHKIDMFSYKIRSYANGLSFNGRTDIGAMYGKFILDVDLYVKEGVKILIDNGWMEQPPQVAKRDG